MLKEKDTHVVTRGRDNTFVIPIPKYVMDITEVKRGDDIKVYRDEQTGNYIFVLSGAGTKIGEDIENGK
jgi:hypothetical protein